VVETVTAVVGLTEETGLLETTFEVIAEAVTKRVSVRVKL
jgi:hypothetical protein